MNISDIKINQIKPFDIDDEKLTRLFSFFLHSAPTVNSATASIIDSSRLNQNWDDFIQYIPTTNYTFISPNCKIEKYIEKFNLNNETIVNRRSKGFVCKRKNNNENDYECFLRHVRNAIAHSYVYMKNVGNRKYLLFEDYNKSKNQSALMLLSQSDLKKLKDIIMK